MVFSLSMYSGYIVGLPTNATLQLSLGPDGNLYAATHGRGIWRMPLSWGDGDSQ